MKINNFCVIWTDDNGDGHVINYVDGAYRLYNIAKNYMIDFFGDIDIDVLLKQKNLYDQSMTDFKRFVHEDFIKMFVEDIIKPENPIKEKTAEYSYAFSGWSPEITDVTSDVTYKATYSKIINRYTVTWKDNFGQVLEVDNEVPYGSNIEYNGPKLSSNKYRFIGWFRDLSDTDAVDIDNTTVNGDLVLYAKYELKEELSLTKDVDFIDYGTTNINFKDMIAIALYFYKKYLKNKNKNLSRYFL